LLVLGSIFAGKKTGFKVHITYADIAGVTEVLEKQTKGSVDDKTK
jgi:hypothetical protein